MSRSRVSAKQIEAFVSVAATNSFTAASRQLELSTSAVSSLIGELEASVGARLFERNTRRVVLNDAGRLLLPSALSFYRTLRTVERVAASLDQESNRTIRVAAPMVIASAILPRVIAEFQKTRPHAQVAIIETSVEWLAEHVASGEVDLAVGPDRATDDSVSSEALLPSAWVAWLSPDHPLAAQETIQWRDLRGTEFHTGGHDHERIIEEALSGLAENERPVPGQVFVNITTALGLASADLGVALCPAYVAPIAQAFRLTARRLIDPEFTRYVMLYRSAARPTTEVATAFADVLRASFGQFAQTAAI